MRQAILTSFLVTALTLPVYSAPRAKKAKASADDLPSATVLCYHIVESPQDDRMEVSRETFRQHMRYLAMTGYNVIPLSHLYEYVSGKRETLPRNAVVITIDDGWKSTYTEVFPEMQKRKFPFTVFIYPRIIGAATIAMTWKQIKEMSDAGVDIQSHSLSHPFLTRGRHRSLDDDAYAAWLHRELKESKRILEHHTGRTVNFLAYPYGDYDNRVATTAKSAGYDAALTCDFGRVKRGSDALRMKRVVIDKRMSFAEFRRYLGASSMNLAEVTPPPGEVIDPALPVVVTARIPEERKLEPTSVGMALLTLPSTAPYSYDARTGSLSLVLKDALETLRGKTHRAIVWGIEATTGKRVEYSWTFKLPEPAPAQPAPQPIAAGSAPAGAAPSISLREGRSALHRAPR